MAKQLNLCEMVQKMDLRKDENLEDRSPKISSCGDKKQSIFAAFDMGMNLAEYMTELPTGGKFLNTEIVYVLPNIEKPIGITMLTNNNIVVADRGKNVVRVYDPDSGAVVKTLKPERNFKLPSDMVTLPDGRLVVRDNNGLQLFDEEGQYIQRIIPQGVFGQCFGVASDGRGNILTINTNPRGIPDCITKEGETDVLKIDFEADVILEKIELVDIIQDRNKSKCRFLQCDGRKVYVVDLGLNQIYVLTLGKQLVRKFGLPGRQLGEFRDPAGIAVDSVGNMIVADAGNNRLQVFDKKRKCMGSVKLSTLISRPSGIYLDVESKSLYVLNLRGNSLVKVNIIKN